MMRILTALTLLFSLVACSNTPSAAPGSGSPTPAADFCTAWDRLLDGLAAIGGGDKAAVEAAFVGVASATPGVLAVVPDEIRADFETFSGTFAAAKADFERVGYDSKRLTRKQNRTLRAKFVAEDFTAAVTALQTYAATNCTPGGSPS